VKSGQQQQQQQHVHHLHVAQPPITRNRASGSLQLQHHNKPHMCMHASTVRDGVLNVVQRGQPATQVAPLSTPAVTNGQQQQQHMVTSCTATTNVHSFRTITTRRA
jgi:hypothetical protein